MQKAPSKYLLPSGLHFSNGDEHHNGYKVEKPNPLEQGHTLLFLTRFFIRNLRIWMWILGFQVLVTLGIVYLSPVKFEASCTILPRGNLQDIAFGANVSAGLTSSRFIALAKSDFVQKPAIKSIMDHDKLDVGDAYKLYFNHLKFIPGSEGEVTITFEHTDQEFSKLIIQNLISNCHSINKNIYLKNMEPSFRLATNRIAELKKEIEGIPTPVSEFEVNSKINLSNELKSLEMKLSALNYAMQPEMENDYFILNALSADEVSRFKATNLIIINVALILAIIYFSALYQSTNVRVKSLWKLISRNL